MNTDVIRRFTVGALVAVLLAAGCESTSTGPLAQKPGRVPEQTDEGLSGDALLDALLSDYERYGLPMPPESAFLVVYVWPRTERFRQYQALAWFDPDAATDDNTNVWLGLRTLLAGSDLTPAEPTAQLAAGPEIQDKPPWMWDRPFGASECSDLLPMAVQAWSLGHREFARALLTRVRADEDEPWRIRMRAMLAHAAWNFWCNELLDLSGDRAAALTHLEALHESDVGLGTDYHRSLVDDLRLTLATPAAPEGSLEALIDALVTHQPIHYAFPMLEPPYRAIVERGFEIVPLLIDHFDDRRVTHSYMTQDGPLPPIRHRRVSDVIRKLLPELTQLGSGCKQAQTRDEIDAWWRRAQAQGEEAYLLANALGRDYSGRKELSYMALRMLSLRYPQHLPELYEKLRLESPEVDTAYLEELLGQADPGSGE